MTITIEPIEYGHSEYIQEVVSDPEMAKTSDIPHPLAPGGASAWIERMKALAEQRKALTFAILADGRAVGGCQLGKLDCNGSKSGELGFFVGRPFWGRGYATEGSRLLLRHAFCDLGLVCVRAACLAWNEAAVRVLRKLGFECTHEGPPPQGSKFPESERFQFWILSREDWESAFQ
jgi:RimJ/RimL family protein N-acetyltransferase